MKFGPVKVIFPILPPLLLVVGGEGLCHFTLSMPYAMLTGCLPPNKIGIYVGIFNFFIVLPEIIASLFFGYVMTNLLDDSRMAAVTVGGILLITAALVTLLISEDKSTAEL